MTVIKEEEILPELKRLAREEAEQWGTHSPFTLLLEEGTEWGVHHSNALLNYEVLEGEIKEILISPGSPEENAVILIIPQTFPVVIREKGLDIRYWILTRKGWVVVSP